jgi:C1A family cysteine protease
MALQVKGFGWLRDYNDPRDYAIDHPKVNKILTSKGTKKHHVLKASDLPSNVDNRKWCSPIEDQGQLGSCTANAGVGMYEYMENKANGTYTDGSRLFLYKATRLLMGDQGIGDSGAWIRTTLGAIRLFGIPNEVYWPYSDAPDKFDIMPEAWLWAFGQNFQSIAYFRLDTSADGNENIKSIKQYVNNGYAVDYGFTVFQSYTQSNTNGGIFPFPASSGGRISERTVGGHSVLIVGYDDKKVAKNTKDGNTKTGCFLIRNSWGTSWGDHGYGWFPYEYFLTSYNGDTLADDAWAITSEEWVDTEVFNPPT